ncbi:TraB/GumN family protein [Pleionea mediterranea]|uniref:TraB family protein n=1 Tax=Pleionea mediterranea TaxID=523701 RepID=A0A316FC04_9GAMM|nr:TraB/GumN family protein [Pleionea mediterranea]PWK43615.1 hypothetical protein C8D97_11629 [Pleionea mediterranea]
MKKIVIAALIVFSVLSSQSSAKTFVWKVEKDQKSAFIAGTIHVLREQDKSLPEAYNLAYQQADVVAFEVDLKEMMAAVFKMAHRGMYQDGTKLSDVLSPEVFQQLENFCNENGFPLKPMLEMKPTSVSVNIMLGMMMREGAKPEGIDMMFNKKARQDGKGLLALESIDDQLDALFNDDVDGDALIKSTIRDAKNADKMLDKMVSALYQGDVDTFKNDFLLPFEKESPEYYKSLIVVRNNNWIPKIEAMLATPEKELIMVGGLHLVGDIGVIEQLKSRGYTVTQMD